MSDIDIYRLQEASTGYGRSRLKLIIYIFILPFAREQVHALLCCLVEAILLATYTTNERRVRVMPWAEETPLYPFSVQRC